VSIPVYAANAVSCLGVKPGEHFQALVDEPFADVGARLCDAALAAGAVSAACVVVPDSARPLLTAYEPFVASLGRTDAICFWFMHIHDGEFAGFRKPLYARAVEAGTRVAPLATGAEGVCVIDRSIALGGEGLVDEPVQLTFRQGRIVAVEGGRSAESTRAAIAEAGAGADVVAELGIGTNASARITGSVITDEKVLGTAHVAFGDNASASYGGDNKAAIHVDGVMADATIEADGEVVFALGALA